MFVDSVLTNSPVHCACVDQVSWNSFYDPDEQMRKWRHGEDSSAKPRLRKSKLSRTRVHVCLPLAGQVVFLCVPVARTHRLGGFKNRSYFLTALEAGVEGQVKVLAGLISPGFTTTSSSRVPQNLAFADGNPWCLSMCVFFLKGHLSY